MNRVPIDKLETTIAAEKRAETQIKSTFLHAACFGASSVIMGAVAVNALQKPSVIGIVLTLGAAAMTGTTMHLLGKGAIEAARYAKGKAPPAP